MNNYGSMLSYRRSSSGSYMDQIFCNLISIQDDIKKLNQFQKSIGKASDSIDLRKKIQNTQKYVHEKMRTTSHLIEKLDKVRRESNFEKIKKIKSEKLINEFQTIEKAFLQNEKTLNAKLRSHVLAGTSSGSFDQIEESDGEENSSVPIQTLKLDIDVDLSILVEREEGVRKIEQDVTDIADMMNKISELVIEQKEDVVQIETNVGETDVQIQEGTRVLKETSKYQQKLRKKSIYVLICVAIFTIIIISILIHKL